MSDNLSSLSGRKGLDNNLFDQLVEKSKLTGTPENSDLKQLAHDFLMGDAITYGASSFYDFLKPEHRGVKAHVCNGSTCLLAGTQEKVVATLEEHLDPTDIGHMCCLGRCHENAAFNYREKNYSGNDIEHLASIIKGTEKSKEDEYVVKANVEPVLTGPKITINQYVDLFRTMMKKGNEWALEQIKVSNVRGRGGAGFPMGFKFESCKSSLSEQKFIVCNADEGDPGAYSDRYLLEKQPLSVLFGMMVAGYIVGADRGVLYIRGEYPESLEAVQEAIDQLESVNFHGDQIDGGEFSFKFKIIEGAGAYICGEETALLSSIEGQRPEVRVRPPYPTQEGLFNKPTIVNNVETLACIPWIIENGGDQYAALGTEKSSGTKLVCLDSFFNNPGVYEIEMGTPFDEVIYQLGGGFKEPVKAVHVGGPLGGIVPVGLIDRLTLDFESFDDQGFLIGHAGVVSIPQSFPHD